MTTYRVDPAGGGDFTTIAAAYAALVSGDVLELEDGATFAEGSIASPGAQTGVTVRRSGDGGSRPLWDYSGHAYAGTYFHDWAFEGIQFTGGTAHAIEPRSGSPDRLTLRELLVYSAGGVVRSLGDDCVLEELVCRDLSGGAGAMIGSVTGSTGSVARSVLLYRCAHGIDLGTSGDLEHVSLVSGTQTSGTALDAGSGTARNCLVYDPGPNLADALKAATYDACCVGGLQAGVAQAFDGYTIGTPPAGSIEADPLFEDAGSDDYRPSLESPCRGTGSASAVATEDAIGESWRDPRDIGGLVSVPDLQAFTVPRRSFVLYGLDGSNPSGAAPYDLFPPSAEWSGDALAELEQAVAISLFTDRRVPAEDLPAGATSRGGWWADTFVTEEDGAPLGSRLWLTERARIVDGAVLTGGQVNAATFRVELETALGWLVETGVATSLDVTVERAALGRLDAQIRITRDERETVDLRFADLWRTYVGV